MTRALVRLAAATVFIAALGGCSTVKGWFSGKDKEGEKPVDPAELVDFTPTATVAKLWSANIGKGEQRLGLQQVPVVDDGRVYAAAVEGGGDVLRAGVAVGISEAFDIRHATSS